MNFLQAAAAIVLWQTRQFDTQQIADLLSVAESDVDRLVHAAKEYERGPDLHVVQGAYQ